MVVPGVKVILWWMLVVGGQVVVGLSGDGGGETDWAGGGGFVVVDVSGGDDGGTGWVGDGVILLWWSGVHVDSPGDVVAELSGGGVLLVWWWN